MAAMLMNKPTVVNSLCPKALSNVMSLISSGMSCFSSKSHMGRNSETTPTKAEVRKKASPGAAWESGVLPASESRIGRAMRCTHSSNLAEAEGRAEQM